MKYRRIVLIFFIVLVGASVIYALMDHRRVTTSSEKAYQAYLKGEEYYYRLYTNEALDQFEEAIKFDPNFAMAHARAAWIYRSRNNSEAYEKSKLKAMSLLDKIKEKERLVINLGFARAEQKSSDVEKYGSQLMAKFPDSFEALEYQASKSFDASDFRTAIEWINKIVEKYPNHAPSYNLLGYSYFNIGEYDKALENIDKYSSLAQDQANPHDSYGEMLLYLGRYDEALAQFRMADSIKSGLYFVVGHIGAVYMAKGMYRDAIGAYLKAGELSPNKETRADIKSQVGLCYLQSGQVDKGVGILQENVTEAPRHLRSHAILGGVFADLGRMDDALIQLGIVKSLTIEEMANWKDRMQNEDMARSAEYYLEAKIEMAKGDYSVAIDRYGRILGMMTPPNPDREYLVKSMADALLKANKGDSAVAILSGLLKFNPNSSINLLCLSEAYRQLGQKNAMHDALTRYLSVMKDADEGIPEVAQATTLSQQAKNR